MFVHGEWAVEKGGVPASFGRYGAQRHHRQALAAAWPNPRGDAGAAEVYGHAETRWGLSEQPVGVFDFAAAGAGHPMRGAAERGAGRTYVRHHG